MEVKKYKKKTELFSPGVLPEWSTSSTLAPHLERSWKEKDNNKRLRLVTGHNYYAQRSCQKKHTISDLVRKWILKFTRSPNTSIVLWTFFFSSFSSFSCFVQICPHSKIVEQWCFFFNASIFLFLWIWFFFLLNSVSIWVIKHCQNVSL